MSKISVLNRFWISILILCFSVSSYVFHSGFKKRERTLQNMTLLTGEQNTLILLTNSQLKNYSQDLDEKTFLEISNEINRYEEIIKTLRFGGIHKSFHETIQYRPISQAEVTNLVEVMYSEWKNYKMTAEKYMKDIQFLTPDQKAEKLREYTKSSDEIYRLGLKLEELLLLEVKINSRYDSISLILFFVFLFGAIFTFYLVFRDRILVPFKRVMNVITLISKGVLTEKIHFYTDNEIGKVAKAVDDIVDYQLRSVEVLEKIGNAEFSVQFEKSGPDDKLGFTITEMRQKLLNFYDEDRKKSFISNWTSQGVALFAEILRNNTDDIDLLCDKVISELIKYLDANQGAIYMLDENKEKKQVLNLISIYAWKRKKYLEKQVEIGEGLLGQAVLEQDTLYITDVPNDFVHISSGLGDANPNSLLIVPMMVNKDIFGVIEIASFKPFENYQIEFVEKIGENVASSLSSVRANSHTKKLLKESQALTEAMIKQEEELRHNAEELQATQESINQNLQKLDLEKKKNIAILESCADGVVIFDGNGNIEFFNKAAEEIWVMNRASVLNAPINVLADLEIDHKDHKVIYQPSTTKKTIGIRTEIQVKDSNGEEVPVLMTISVNQIGDSYVYAAFVQSIAVELF